MRLAAGPISLLVLVAGLAKARDARVEGDLKVGADPAP